jgi:magnesium transporter
MPETTSINNKSEIAEKLLTAIADKNNSYVKEIVGSLVDEEIAEFLEAIPPKERNELWLQIDRDIQADILAHTNNEVTSSLLEQLSNKEIVELTENLETDDITDIAQAIPETKRQHVLSNLTDDVRGAVETALTYPEDTAGGLMSANFISIRSDVSVEAVLRLLRKIDTIPDSTTDLFVRDRNGYYKGVLPIAKLITNDEDTPIFEIMEQKQAITASLEETEVAHIFEKNDLLSIAVTDENNLLLGLITIDDVVDIIREEAERNQMAVAGLNDEDDLFAPPLKSAKRRTVWLGLNLLTAIFASIVIGLFEATIQQIVTLAVLMPIVASMGGIAGTQTATIVIRAMATGKLGSQNTRHLIFKETGVGLLNGLVWAAITGITISLLFEDTTLGLIFGSAMLINLIVAAIAGAVIPLILDKMDIDPALAAGLILTTVTDTIGFFIFLGLATIILT